MNANTNGGKPPILLVDDEPEVLFSLKALLRREFTLYTAESGKEALKIMQEHPVHVVMTDQRMPEMTGAELLAKARKFCPDAVRIVFTGYADIKAVVDTINSGRLYRYITKPWDPDELIETLHEAAREYAKRERHHQLLRDVNQLLEESLPELAEGNSAEADRTLRLGESLRSRIQDELRQWESTR